MLVTRPLIARPALPRFVRAGDSLVAGVVVNQRAGGTPTVRVDATVQGAALRGNARREATLEAGRGAEVRYPFRVQPGDSAIFQFAVRSAAGEDAVRTRLPVRPEFHPVTHTIAGVVRDTATAEFILPGDIDPARSRVSINLGTSPLAVLQGLRDQLQLYPYYCTEQLTSVAMPLLALYTAGRKHDLPLVDEAGVRDLQRAVTQLSRRQRTDGGIGMWRADDWTTPYLTAHATRFLLGAREAGIAVNDSVLARAAGYLVQSLATDARGATPVAHWYTNVTVVLSDQVAAIDVLSRLGIPQVAAENRLLARAAQLRVEDRLRLAEALHRRGEVQSALRLIAPAWASVKLEGRRAAVPADTSAHYFRSTMGPTARLLTATLAINPSHPLVGPLVESLVSGNQGRGWWSWNTQDAALVVEALAAAEQTIRSSSSRAIRARAGQRVIAVSRGGTADSSAALTGIITSRPDGTRSLRVSVDAQGEGISYWFATVTEVPRTPPVTPRETGIAVERWYESYETGRPITAVTEGELVRVRLRVTVPRERHFVVLDDALPAGLEAVDLSLRTAAPLPGPGIARVEETEEEEEGSEFQWGYGRWDGGWWTPFDHRELRDDRVVYVASVLWPGTYTATYVARATTPGVFTRPPAHAQEMYNPAVYGRSEGGVFTVRQR